LYFHNSTKVQQPAHFKQLDDPVASRVTDQFAAQTEVVIYIFEGDAQDIGTANFHGNSALHYLVSHGCVKLMEWIGGFLKG
jgi:hypothetical protein